LGCTSQFIRVLSVRVAALTVPLVFAPAAVHAQAPTPPSNEPRSEEAGTKPDAVPLTLPEPIETPLEYPEDAEGSSLVVLELTVDSEGRVAEARTVFGEAPFAKAARSAALAWRFQPARRGAIAIPARIRFSVRFTPPPEPVTPPSPGQAAPSGSPEEPSSREPERPAPLEIVVTGKRRPPGSVEVTREDARALPGSFGDPLRALEAQPGVVPIVSGLPAFFIRGAPPSNVGFFLDGVDLPLLYHAFLGPSVVHPRLVGSVEFYPGAAPVQYGRFAGPVVAVNPSPFEGRFTGEGTLRVIDVGGFVEGPYGACETAEPECSPSSARVAGRYSYTGLVLSALSDSKLDYWDYLGQVEHVFGRKDRVSVLAFGGYDYFRAPQESENNGGELTFHRVDLRWDHRWTKASHLRVAVTGGYDRAAGAVEDSSVVTDESLRARLELEHRVSDRTTIHAGLDARGDRFGLGTNPRYLSYPDYSTLFPERADLVAGAYVSAEVFASRGIRVSPGVRADLYRSQGTTALGVDPRVSAEIYVSPRTRFEHSIGIAHQRPNFAAQVPGAQVADLDGGLQWALLWSSGIRFELPYDLNASASVFRTAYFRALDPIGGGRDFTIDRTVLERRSTVSGAGVELRVQRPLTKRLGGFISYTLSRSEQSTATQKSLSGFDRPHVLQGALGYDLGRGVQLAARAVLYSGIPELNLESTPNFTSNRRGAPYFRMDVRGAKRWQVNDHVYWELVAEILNATSTSEVVRLDCGERCRERVAGPVILPSVGIQVGF
jgi:TonB family protein